MTTTNPLLAPWNTPYGLPPFAEIRPEHFAPAFAEAFRRHREELAAIANAPEPPTFANTIVAFDRAGALLDRIGQCFWNLTAAHTSAELQALERELAPQWAAHFNAIYMDERLFARIDAVMQSEEARRLDEEDRRLLERVHRDFVLEGARIAPEHRARYAQIVERLAELQTRFAQNVLKEEADWTLWLDTEADRAGLPQALLDAARGTAAERGRPDGYAITLSRSSVVPFLTFSTRRDLRERAWRAWTSRGANGGPTDNRALIVEILKLRAELARLHGCANFAEYALADRMAQHPQAARALLERIWRAALATFERERVLVEANRIAHGVHEPLEPWDWRFYEERVRQASFALDDTEVKPYFELERMMQAMFAVAGRLFGLTFEEVTGRAEVRLYHPDVRLFEVRRHGRLQAIFLIDNYARPSKQGGAWMSSYRVQHRNGPDGEIIPIVANHNNFIKSAPGQPTLLSFDDVRTLFHEFGHALHGMLSNVRYARLSGTSVAQDYVELPSQLMEHWALEPAVLTEYARHYATGEPIPPALIERIRAAAKFGNGFENVQYIASALLDLTLHERSTYEDFDPIGFEAEQLKRLGMPDAAHPMHRLTHFRHVFAGDDYAAGYYVYLWAAVLDNDAFEAFEEAGDPFHAETAARLYEYIYSAGNRSDPAASYRAFRGRDANPDALLRKRGLVEA
ncbi:MAG: M3 family metallopeptidase [Casimicrobiaceae bacterium]|nr:M3 family metallopeptidase [Casimicrobiaceae bacterium]MCX8098979.1 M3 family metallopeptidase [Casimicrobiaceae bacterium]MDW8313086.1 M3 family metallopeptidase [Burkholderiales bacterium]